MNKKISSPSEQFTKDLATQFASTLKGSEVICLHGQLGAGKTTFVKGLAQALGVKNVITSPTFTLMNIYDITTAPNLAKLIHIDTYRLKDEHELRSIGVEDFLGQPGIVTVVEWPEKINPLLAGHLIKNIYFEHGAGTERLIDIEL